MRIVSLLLLAFLLSTSFAEDRYYRYEMVIFENLGEHNFHAETWPQEQHNQEVALDSEPSINSAAEDSSTLLLLPTGFSKNRINDLSQIIQLLEKSGEYRILLQQAWTQKGVDRNKVIPLHIQTAALSAEHPEPELEGSISIGLARYLHVDTDLTFRKKVVVQYQDGGDVVEQEEIYDIPVVAHRKMRSQELHYIDHPLVGILIKAYPIESGR